MDIHPDTVLPISPCACTEHGTPLLFLNDRVQYKEALERFILKTDIS